MDLVLRTDKKGKIRTKMKNRWLMTLKVRVLRDHYIKQEGAILLDLIEYYK